MRLLPALCEPSDAAIWCWVVLCKKQQEKHNQLVCLSGTEEDAETNLCGNKLILGRSYKGIESTFLIVEHPQKANWQRGQDGGKTSMKRIKTPRIRSRLIPSTDGLDGRYSAQTAWYSQTTALHRRLKKKYKKEPEKVAVERRDGAHSCAVFAPASSSKKTA